MDNPKDNDNHSKCICGKIPMKYCAKCMSKKYCSVECQREDWKRHKLECKETFKIKDPIKSHGKNSKKSILKNNKEIPKITKSQQIYTKQYTGLDSINDDSSMIFNNIKNHIKNNWKFIYELIQLAREDFNNYHTLYCVTSPTGNIDYENTNPKPKYWTFVFIVTKLYPNTIFILWSDHIDGVNKRFHELNKGMFHCSPNNILVSSDYFDNKKILAFPIEIIEDVKYLNVDWQTGNIGISSILDKFEDYKIIELM